MTRILVVEDEPGIALGLEDDLRLEGYDVDVAGDGITAARCARGGTYDLILCDPPYDYDRRDALAPHLARLLAPDGVLVYETDARTEPVIEGLQVRTSRKYGSARLTLFDK